MRIQLRDIIVMFEKIQEEMNIAVVSVVMFCAVDVDSLCTLKILSKLFKSENIQYKVYPVTRYTELFARIEESKVYEQVRLFLFVNCGGILDLTQADLLQRGAHPTLLLFDTNKPIHHKNLESPHIKVIDDGSGALDNCPTSQEIERLEELNEYDLEEQEEDEDEEPGDGSPKRRNKRVFREKLRKHKEVIGERIEGYYKYSFFGFPSSYSAYRLVRDLSKANNDYLWYGVVGMTSMYLQRKLGKEALETLSESYKLDVLRFNSTAHGRRDRGDVGTKRAYHFPLLDHWSLYDSMLNSHYLATKLSLWEDRGLTRLHELIHSLGISLQEAKQLYKYMPLDSQRKLDSSIFTAAEKFGLHEVTFMSFVRHIDCSASLMASDYYCVLTSVLETAPSGLGYEEMYEHRVKCFWKAYDTFDGSFKELVAAMEGYKKMVKVLMTETRNILERDHLIIGNHASIANIKGDTDDRKIFQHPSALIRIAHLLMDITVQRKKAKASKPFVAIWIDLEREVSQVVGVMTDPKNSSGSRFNKVTESLKIEVNHDNFMANIMQLHMDHLRDFVNEITKAES